MVSAENRSVLYSSAAWKPLGLWASVSVSSKCVVGVPTEDSDVDLLIVKETDHPPAERWAEVKRLLRGVAPLVPVSPLVLTPAELRERQAIRDFFIEEILAEGEVVYG